MHQLGQSFSHMRAIMPWDTAEGDVEHLSPSCAQGIVRPETEMICFIYTPRNTEQIVLFSTSART